VTFEVFSVTMKRTDVCKVTSCSLVFVCWTYLPWKYIAAIFGWEEAFGSCRT